MAARVCGLSGPDEILVSSTVHDVLDRHDDVRLVDRGEHALKGIAVPQRVYAVVEPDESHEHVA
jgi:class 3 adenylate cyclase